MIDKEERPVREERLRKEHEGQQERFGDQRLKGEGTELKKGTKGTEARLKSVVLLRVSWMRQQETNKKAYESGETIEEQKKTNRKSNKEVERFWKSESAGRQKASLISIKLRSRPC